MGINIINIVRVRTVGAQEQIIMENCWRFAIVSPQVDQSVYGRESVSALVNLRVSVFKDKRACAHIEGGRPTVIAWRPSQRQSCFLFKVLK